MMGKNLNPNDVACLLQRGVSAGPQNTNPVSGYPASIGKDEGAHTPPIILTLQMPATASNLSGNSLEEASDPGNLVDMPLPHQGEGMTTLVWLEYVLSCESELTAVTT